MFKVHIVDKKRLKVQNAYDQSRHFFLLSGEKKDEFLLDISKSFQGYTKPGQQL